MQLEDSIKVHKISVGDIVMTSNMCAGIVVKVLSGNYYSIFNVSTQYYEDYSKEEFVCVSEEVFDFLLTLSKKSRGMLSKIVYKLDPQDRYGEYGYFLQALSILDSLRDEDNSILVQRVIFANGIQKVVGREKGKAIRYLLLNNGEVWKAHRCKAKSTYIVNRVRKYLSKYKNDCYMPKVSTVHYELIEKVK